MLMKLITCLLIVVIFYGEQIDADSKCDRYNTRSYKYKCKHIRDCNSGSRNAIGCGKGKICCPTYRRPKRQANSIDPYQVIENKCREYAEFRYVTTVRGPPVPGRSKNTTSKVIDCPIVEGNIAGGEDAKLKEFPHMALIGYHPFGSSDEDWNCGGTLISESYVLTAAHCIQQSYEPEVVRLGDLILTKTDDALHKDYKIIEKIPHPEYNSSSKYNDIALLKLNANVQLTPSVRPACLYSFPNVPKSHDKVSVTGFGITRYGDAKSERLLKATIKLLPEKRCKMHYKSSPDIVNGYNPKTMLCAGDANGIKDTCQGDSGGPIQVEMQNWRCVWSQLGITSFGKICGRGEPAIYTRIYPYIPWIQSIVWPRGT